MARGVIATLCLAFVLSSSCAMAAGETYEAYSADGRIKFTLQVSSAKGAFDRFCATNPNPRCDAFEAYDIEVSVRDLVMAMHFSHREARVTPLHPGFDCPFDGRRFNCFEDRRH